MQTTIACDNISTNDYSCMGLFLKISNAICFSMVVLCGCILIWKLNMDKLGNRLCIRSLCSNWVKLVTKDIFSLWGKLCAIVCKECASPFLGKLWVVSSMVKRFSITCYVGECEFGSSNMWEVYWVSNVFNLVNI